MTHTTIRLINLSLTFFFLTTFTLFGQSDSYEFTTSENTLTLEYSVRKSGTEINWAPASEETNDYFMIERSSDGFMFYEIGKVLATYKGNTEKNYNFFDNTSKTNKTYYRLNQINLDGSNIYSNVIVIHNNSKKELDYESIPSDDSDLESIFNDNSLSISSMRED